MTTTATTSNTRSDQCLECGGEFVWDIDAGSAVCISCGILQDPSQNVLDTHLDNTVDKPYDQYGHLFSTRTTLKRLRNQTGWDLAGQGNVANIERNKIAMHQYIVSLSTRVGHLGLAPRAQLLFDQAMTKGNYRFGRKARLVAGASLAIALREAQKGETIKDIAFLIDETPVAIARVFTSTLRLLDIKLTSMEVAWHLPVLQKLLSRVLTEQPVLLPQNLIKILRLINIPTAFRTASSLSDLVSRAAIFPNLPSPPTACAVYILTLEGEASTSFPNCGELAGLLARRVGVSQDTVMRRYKMVYDQVFLWSTALPWLANSAGSPGKKSSKISKRLAAARNLKDVVQFQEMSWRSTFQALPPPAILTDEAEIVSVPGASSEALVDPQDDTMKESSLSSKQQKKSKRTHLIDDVSQFLLSPLSSSQSSRSSANAKASSFERASYLLTAEAPSLVNEPTRLQLLVHSKGVDEITDEELFAEGELEGFMRSEEERHVVAQSFDWAKDHPGNESPDDHEGQHTTQARTRNRGRGGTSRINIEALNRLLHEADDIEWTEPYYTDDDWAISSDQPSVGDDLFNQDTANLSKHDETPGIMVKFGGAQVGLSSSSAATEEVMEPWRPLSPGAETHWDDLERYEEH